MIRLTLPIKTTNPLNCGQGFSKNATFARARTRRIQRGTTLLAVAAELQRHPTPLPVVVTLTRVAPSSGLDDDALGPSMKSVRDGIADALKLTSDRDPRITWRYAQRRGAFGVYRVEVVVIERKGADEQP